jgi:O-antigen/teichoic acid export membrane protein
MIPFRVPSITDLALVVEHFIQVAFGEQLLSVAQKLQMLCVVDIILSLRLIILNVLQAQDQANLYFRMEVIK